MRIIFYSCFAVLLVAPVWSADPMPNSLEYFEAHIRPVLVQHCYECHSSKSEKIEGGLALDSAIGWQSGGDSGPAVIAGDPEQSMLLTALRYEGLEMPPKGRLPEEVVKRFEDWIAAGAIDPRGGELPDQLKRKIDIEKDRHYWSFQPRKTGSPPHPLDDAWSLTTIDAYLLQAMRDQGVEPVEMANPAVALRRLAFDLTGLPPSEEMIQDFLKDPSEKRWRYLVDKMLMSPEFAEHWGRHWLDVARYADSNGSDFNATFHHAWRYRNWVIQSIAADLPIDRFIQLQIAGDLLPYQNDLERTNNLVATGFLMVGPKMLSERNKDKLRMDVVDEQIDSIGKTFMGLTLGCARCHDHKFDPIPTEDYYALAGILRSTRVLQGESQKYVSAWKDTVLPSDASRVEEVEAHKKRTTEIDKQLKSLQKKIDDLTTVKKKVETAKADAADKSEVASEAEREIEKIDSDLTELQEQLKSAQESQKQHKAETPKPLEMAFAAAEMPSSEIADAFVCIRGEVENVGPIVPRGFLQVCSTESIPHSLSTSQSGRAELAMWLTDPNHPLVGRVFVNRVWMHLVGEGLVRTVDNFGTQGESPSHPELLDRLTTDFVADDWSLRRLVRRIVLSRFYRLSSAPSAKANEVDPENRLLWRAHRRRIPAEGLRDTLLASAGILNRTPSTHVMEKFAVLVDQNVASTNVSIESAQRRTVYEPVIRNYVSPLLVAFDFADPDLIVGQRPTTNVPAQALVLLNSPEVLGYVKKIRTAVLNESSDKESRIEAIYQKLLGRPPTNAERVTIDELIGDGSPKDDVWETLIHSIVASTSFRFLD